MPRGAREEVVDRKGRYCADLPSTDRPPDTMSRQRIMLQFLSKCVSYTAMSYGH